MRKRGVACILQPGGSRVLGVAGAITGAELHPDQVSVAYASSSAGLVGAMFMAGQIARIGFSWIDELVRSEFLDWWRFSKLRLPAEPKRLIETACRGLDLDAIRTDSLIVSTLKLETGESQHHAVTKKNALNVLEATISLPIIAKPKWFEGGWHVDGGVGDPYPALRAHEDGWPKILVFGSRPPEYRMSAYGWHKCLSAFPRWPHARRALSRPAARFHEAKEFLAKPPPDVETLVIEPERPWPSDRLTSDRSRIWRTYELGFELGRRNRQRIQDFVEAN